MNARATIADLTDDRVIYRDLQPCDPALPGIATLRTVLGLPANVTPRKRDMAYAHVILALARAAQALRNGLPLTTVVVIGDTDNDRLLTVHLQRVGEVAAYGFIGVDRPVAPATLEWVDGVASATRWALAHQWAAELTAQGVDWSRTAVLIDIDKTLLGPRGRSDGAIDDARAEAAVIVATELLGNRFDRSLFRRNYAELCRREWHPITLDNQDYTVAMTIFATIDVFDLPAIEVQLAAGLTPTLLELLIAAQQVPAELEALRRQLIERIEAGDPTPFTQFRRVELVTTAARMADGRLTLSGELFTLGQQLQAQGALLLAASDKPAESALPTPEQVAAGLLPLHRTPALLD
ncbi:hypothetical protein [Chloroflexus sp.]|uniref:hypothetical protein n=1 Tax=Chloroflexus sp. TaxID=1904827 RepID=UPI00262EAAAD|nr:hypothetical protein [uncultured Chloroflexus sp.]